MKSRGFAVDVVEMICPDRWEYKYDGVKFMATEYFGDNISRAELEDLKDRWIRSGGDAKLKGNKLTVEKTISRHYAVANLALEGVLQASILELVTRDTQYLVIADVLQTIPEEDSKEE